MSIYYDYFTHFYIYVGRAADEHGIIDYYRILTAHFCIESAVKLSPVILLARILSFM